MTMQQMALEAIQHLDGGRVNEAFNQALKRAGADCEERPGEDKVRKVLLQAEIKPILDQDGMCETVEVKFQVKEVFPTRRSKKYGMQLRRGGMIAFSDVTADGSAAPLLDAFGESEDEDD